MDLLLCSAADLFVSGHPTASHTWSTLLRPVCEGEQEIKGGDGQMEESSGDCSAVSLNSHVCVSMNEESADDVTQTTCDGATCVRLQRRDPHTQMQQRNRYSTIVDGTLLVFVSFHASTLSLSVLCFFYFSSTRSSLLLRFFTKSWINRKVQAPRVKRTTWENLIHPLSFTLYHFAGVGVWLWEDGLTVLHTLKSAVRTTYIGTAPSLDEDLKRSWGKTNTSPQIIQ